MKDPISTPWRPLRVRAVRLETDTVRTFELAPLDGRPLPAWTPGAHVDIRVDGGVRQYSLCGDPEAPSWHIAVKRSATSRGGSAWLHAAVVPGMTLEVGAPRNAFSFDAQARRVVLMGAGIGITPLLPMWRAAHRRGMAVTLDYAASGAGEAAFIDQLHGQPGVRLHLDGDRAAAIAAAMPAWTPGAVLYTCGPPGFMRHVFDCATAMGWPAEALRMEAFGQTEPAVPVSASVASACIPVRFVRSGVEALAAPDKTLLAVARRHGVEIGTGCEQGLCGACMTGVQAGAPEHLDSYLSDAERMQWVLPCVSRCGGGPLVLEA